MAGILHTAASARADSIRSERDWTSLVEFRVNKVSKNIPSVAAAVRDCAKYLTERAFRHTARLRTAMQPLEKITRRFDELHNADVSSLTGTLNEQHLATVSSLSAELNSLEAEVAVLKADRASRDAIITKLEAEYESVQAARRLDVLQLAALLPTRGFELVETDDAEFEAALLDKVQSQSQTHRRAAAPTPGKTFEARQAWREVDAKRAQAEARAAHAELRKHMKEAPKAIRVWRRNPRRECDPAHE